MPASALAAFRTVAASILTVVTAGPLFAQATRADSAGAVTAVARFHDALTAQDSARAVSILAPDMMVIEGGVIQTRAEYLSQHLGADMKAQQGSKGTRSIVRVTTVGDLAYVISKTVTPATNADGSNGSELAELMILSRAGSDWTIRAVHWSSRRRRS